MIIVMDNLNAAKPDEDASIFGRAFNPKTSNNGVFADIAAFNAKVTVLFLGRWADYYSRSFHRRRIL
jgi:hypothetical protein